MFARLRNAAGTTPPSVSSRHLGIVRLLGWVAPMASLVILVAPQVEQPMTQAGLLLVSLANLALCLGIFGEGCQPS